jgi:S-sulfosulfanyl-L-cysteine sulfohydrolase
MRRRDVLQLLTAAALAGMLPRTLARAAEPDELYAIGRFGNARVLHMTDMHAQLTPVHFREPSVNIGIGGMAGRPPHIVGEAFLKYFGIAPNTRAAHAFTCLDYAGAAHKFGKLGGFAHLKTLIDRLRAETPDAILLDGGDLWQGSGLSDALKGADMVEAANLLGIEAMASHWEFTYGEDRLREHLKNFKGDFLAQNVFLTEEAGFNGKPAFDPASGRVFKPALVREIGGYRVGIIGQAFPYVPIAHPKRFTPDWTFGIRDADMQKLVDELRQKEKVDAVLLLSHNGMDVDMKLASRVSGIDVILGGHTHDAVPQPLTIANPGGKTLVTNAGSSGKFLGVLDLELGKGAVKKVRYRLLPVYSGLLKPDPAMQALIDRRRQPYAQKFDEQLAVATDLLYRRGNFNGPMDQLICDCLREELDAELALSPGFRWGNTMLPGEPITMDDVLSETAMTYPQVYVQEMTGAQIKDVMEDICDNLFNPDPYYQQGGDMVRIGGMDYSCAPNEGIGNRISEMTLDSGKPLEPNKIYKVAGWASVNPQDGKPVSEVFAAWLRRQKSVRPKRLNRVALKGLGNNPGLADVG